jgi:hypothetical protein
VPEIEGDHPHGVGVLLAGHGGRDLQIALGADEIGVELGAERVTAPSDTVGVSAGAAQQGIVDGQAKGLGRREQDLDGMMDVIEESVGGDAVVREQAVSSGPIQELLAASGQQAGNGSASEAQ